MAQPARRPEAVEEVPRYDPDAVRRTLLRHRARRQARVAHKRARRHARIRFFVVVLTLLAASIALLVVVWREVQRIFGL